MDIFPKLYYMFWNNRSSVGISIGHCCRIRKKKEPKTYLELTSWVSHVGNWGRVERNGKRRRSLGGPPLLYQTKLKLVWIQLLKAPFTWLARDPITSFHPIGPPTSPIYMFLYLYSCFIKIIWGYLTNSLIYFYSTTHP